MQVKRFAGFFSFFLLCFFSFTSAWSYPLDEITLTNCTDHNCTFPLPKIEHADYFSYKNNALYRQIYSMLRLGTYFERRDVGKGSHQGIDIATATGTPVYASADGEVVVAGSRGDWGNVIVIKHQRNNQTLYTTYAHLSTMSVKVGQQVKEGEMIGTVGATGNATGPHLHFQIEKNQDTNHPFFPKGCQGSIDEIVNEGTCFAQVRAATLDPIFFLETSVSLAESANISPIERVYIQAEEMLFTGFLGGFMQTQSMQQLIVKRSKEKGWVFLSSPLTFSGNEHLITISPEKIQVLEEERSVFLQSTATTGFTLIHIQYGDETLAIFPLLINTPEGIAAWKENTTLMTALRLLGLQ